MKDTEEGHLLIENFVNIVAQSSRLLSLYIYINMKYQSNPMHFFLAHLHIPDLILKLYV